MEADRLQAEADANAEPQVDDGAPHVLDTWQVNNDVVIRVHNRPREALYVPSDDDFPIPTRYIDVMRTTHTSLKDKCESVINHHRPDDDGRKLSNYWTGRNTFVIMRPDPKPGWKWVNGRKAKIQVTPRPGNVDSETLWRMKPQLQEQAKEDWKVER